MICSWGAELSPCRTYRYSLWRSWDANAGICIFIGLNPSTADETHNDATIRKCMRFAERWGYGGLIMLNLFAYRATNPKYMRTASDPVGPNNDNVLMRSCNAAAMIVAAWGNHGYFNCRAKEVIAALSGREIYCFSVTKRGQPVHPLYQRNDAELELLSMDRINILKGDARSEIGYLTSSLSL